ncbi:serine/threonine-protein phosphatase 6 regulatory subunit 2a isoform X1 [Hemibagrus wyckioides]|nr:serine/threonine-protein phosphatase 6 regulatory subunit 2a isoform X1 [Hemibagrus wyckioides]XP_058263867.1 serine/threonine-protein phosphatase 6 regulatory subunit 2a isoform X1 [Hemibagrus wyckioides]XP_058263868.1 serine/threonine-protein phosphatase 6 regulatory subunit 2a isoform X1 [Hemibagrus wyckioides]
MFWKFDLHTTSHIDQLLDREDVTLKELMEEEDLLQECKAQNHRLLLFLVQDYCMHELVSLITEEPPSDLEERTRFKLPNIACDILTSDVATINDKLGGDVCVLEKLYSFLEQDPPLNPLLASFFSKTIGNLIARKTEQMISFLRKKHNFISLVLNHIDVSPMMDLLLRLISCVEPAPLRQEVLNWLNEERLIQRLTELMHTGRDEERQSNASQTLCDIIRLSRDQASQIPEAVEPDPLLAVLESEENVAQLLKSMFEKKTSEASVVNGTQVLLTLLESRRTGLEGLMELYSQGCERSYTVNSSILRTIEPHLKDFQQLLLDPPKKSAILTTVGVLEQPLGNARLHVARLVASLLQTSDNSICEELCRLNTMDLLLDLFFKYTWNNFLHFQVEMCVTSILNHSAHMGLQSSILQNHEEKPEEGQNSSTDAAHVRTRAALVANLFQKCRLVQRILYAWEENDRIQAEGGTRRGNMGHLTRIANTVVQNLEKGHVQSQISDLIKELPEDCRGRWESFVGETLRETNRRNTVDLVSTHNLHSSSEDDDMESPFPNDLSIQQAFSDYQIQQMTANFVDQFGFNDEEFSEHDENINATFDRIAEINFNIDADDNSASAAAFEACCKERIQQFDDCEEEEDIWEDKEISYATQVKSRSRFGVSLSSESSPKGSVRNGMQGCRSAREDEDEEGKNQVSTQTATSPKYQIPQTPQSPVCTANFDEAKDIAWGSASNQANEEHHGTEWANFTEFQPFCSSSSNTENMSEMKGQKAPLLVSDCSSSGGSDSKEDVGNDKTVDASKAADNQKAAAVQAYSEAPAVELEKLTITDAAAPSESQTLTPDAENTTVTDKRFDAPSEPTPNGPI